MVMFNPRPVVYLDGGRVQCATAQLDTAPLALDGIVVDWGRDDYISHATPATAQLALIDRTGTLANRANTRALIGRPLVLEWEDPANTSTRWRWFAGRVTSAVAKPHRTGSTLAHSAGRDWVVSITAAAKDADLGQVMTLPEVWPTQTMLDRAVKLRALAAPAQIAEFYFYPGSTGVSCWPLDVKGRDLKSLVDEFYMSMGDTYSYHPNTNVVRHIYRRKYVAPLRLQRLVSDDLVHVTAPAIAYDGQTYPAASIPGDQATTEDGIELAPNSTVTRVEASWKDRPSGGNDWTSVATAPEGDQNGRRTVTFTSWIDDGLYLDPVLAEVLARGQEEGSVPKHPPIRWDTRPAGGFKSVDEARALVNAAETQGLLTVTGSMFAEWIGRRPVYAILGGTIEYRGGWIVTVTVQWHQPTDAQTPITWPNLDTGLTWRTADYRQLAPDVSWWDMRWLTNGTVQAP
ncbi:minor tail protein [Gordonia phage Schiebs]|nr:minor tail protein [Gordonia phage Schiebs]